MVKNSVAFLLVAVASCSVALADNAQTTTTPASKKENVVAKDAKIVGDDIKKGAEATVHGVEKVGKGTVHGVEALGKGTVKVLKGAGHGIEKVGAGAVHGVEKLAGHGKKTAPAATPATTPADAAK